MTSDFSSATRGERDIGDQVKENANKATDQVRQKASEVASQAQQQVSAGIASQKDSAAHSLSDVAQALRQTGQQLRDQDQVGVTGYIDQAAEQVERLSHYLERNDLGHLVGDLERFARRQPAMFIGGAFLVGLLGARFLRSTRPDQYNDQNSYRRYSGPGETYGGYRGVYGSGLGGAYTPGATYGPSETYAQGGSSTGYRSGETYGTGSGQRDPYTAGPNYDTGESIGVDSERISGATSTPNRDENDPTTREQTRVRTPNKPFEE